MFSVAWELKNDLTGWFWIKISHGDAVSFLARMEASHRLTRVGESVFNVAHSQGFWQEALLTLGRPQFLIM